jgi:hypothetical protein
MFQYQFRSKTTLNGVHSTIRMLSNTDQWRM